MDRGRIKQQGFTLIELLIVVAIIAILAAITVPNFLEAQVRSKVSRMKSDIRTIGMAAETYNIDHNAYPPHRNKDDTEIGYPDRYVRLTTPIAYMTSIPARDVFFKENIVGQGGSLEWVSWTNLNSFPDTHPLYPVRDKHEYMLRSRGPDSLNESNDVRNMFLNLGIAGGPTMIYDPTNGTISRGDIVRTRVVIP